MNVIIFKGVVLVSGGKCCGWWISVLVNVEIQDGVVIDFYHNFHSLTLRKSIESSSVQCRLTSGHVCVYIVAFATSRW